MEQKLDVWITRGEETEDKSNTMEQIPKKDLINPIRFGSMNPIWFGPIKPYWFEENQYTRVNEKEDDLENKSKISINIEGNQDTKINGLIDQEYYKEKKDLIENNLIQYVIDLEKRISILEKTTITTREIKGFKGKVISRSYKINESIATRFSMFCKEHSEYKVGDLVANALYEYMKKF